MATRNNILETPPMLGKCAHERQQANALTALTSLLGERLEPAPPVATECPARPVVHGRFDNGDGDDERRE